MKGRKTGGRKLGTPNKPKPLKNVLSAHSLAYYTEIVDSLSGFTQFQLDLQELSPAERIQAELKLLNKTIPDLKAVDANITSQSNIQLSVEQRLYKLCQEEQENENEDE